MEPLKKICHVLRPAFTITLAMMLICGLAYPLLMNVLAGVLFPTQAKGDVIEVDGQAVGCKNIGQEFTEDYFMKGRPSAVHYNTYFVEADGSEVYADGTEFGGLASGSNNYAPSNPALAERVDADIEAFLESHPDLTREDLPTDLMTASGSGLDPHISPESAAIQLPAIAEASGLSMQTLESIVDNNTKGKLMGILGTETVNVLGVNIEIAQAMGLTK